MPVMFIDDEATEEALGALRLRESVGPLLLVLSRMWLELIELMLTEPELFERFKEKKVK